MIRTGRKTSLPPVSECLLIMCGSFFVIPVAHFPWSVTGIDKRGKSEKATV